MKPRHSLLPLAIMAMGTTGCFETQRDETFADTVVHDDTEIRVLHASPDSPRLDLLLDGKRKLEDLDYGQARVLTPPADWYDVSVEGRPGPDGTQTLLNSEFDRFDEDRRYDLLVAGSVEGEESTLRSVLLARDKPEPEDSDDNDDDEDEDEEEDESFSLRGVHLVESVDELDVFINSNDVAALTTLDYGVGSETLELDEAVVRIRLQEPGSEEPLFDSGKRERFSAGEDLLMAVVPNTSATVNEDGDSPVKVLILNEDRVKTVRNEAEQSSLRFVNAAAESGELAVEVKRSDEDPVLEGSEVAYEAVLPSSAPADFVFLDNDAYAADVAEAGNGESESKNTRFRRGHGRTVIALNDADGKLDLKSVSNNDRSVVTNARVRVFQGSPRSGTDDGPGAIDVYLLEEGQGLADGEGVIATPLIESLSFRKMSRYEPMPAGEYDLVVTRAGDTEEELLREESISLSEGGIHDLVFAGDNSSGDDDFQLIRIGGVPDS